MYQTGKKICAILLALCMVVGILPLTAQAALRRQGLTQDEDYTLAVARRDTPVILYEEFADTECEEVQ